ncbi:hypothetical protein G2W53_002939 [Senna tora]|uniref:DUF4283 domain-containing protein n=1 Tax=Senna tora TaxID=362788 RepID=A0A835CFA7_9FABA|nr:hypothetical protein G2W53_002939 [Senna tora]
MVETTVTGESTGLSPEEEDILNRNKKKMKNTGEGFSGPSRVRVSYEDIGRDSDPMDDQEQTEVNNGVGFVFEVDPDGDDACVVVNVSEKERCRLSEPFEKALIIKLLGRSIGFKVLEKKLYQLWKVKGILNIIYLSNDYFLVKFSCMSDFDTALLEGPWVIFYHYLTVKPWSLEFDPSTDLIQKLAVWVRFPDLPIEYFDRKFLRCFGNSIGRTVKVDLTTALQARGRRYGHATEGCPNKEDEEEQQQPNCEGNVQNTKVTDMDAQHKKGGSGRKPRLAGGTSTEVRQSRFAALSINDEEEMNIEEAIETHEVVDEARGASKSRKGKELVVIPTHSTEGRKESVEGLKARQLKDVQSRRYFNSNIIMVPNGSGPGPKGANNGISIDSQSRGISSISEPRLSVLKQRLRNKKPVIGVYRESEGGP